MLLPGIALEQDRYAVQVPVRPLDLRVEISAVAMTSVGSITEFNLDPALSR